MQNGKQTKHDLISTVAAIGAPAFTIVFLLSMGWKKAALVVGGVAVLLILLMWMFPPAIDDDDDETFGSTSAN